VHVKVGDRLITVLAVVRHYTVSILQILSLGYLGRHQHHVPQKGFVAVFLNFGQSRKVGVFCQNNKMAGRQGLQVDEGNALVVFME